MCKSGTDPTRRHPPCPTSDCPTAPSSTSTRRSPSPRSPPRSAPASPRPRSPARSTASSSTPRSLIDRDAQLAIVTDKDPDGLDVIRHSTAHLLAYAVKELFPDAQVTIGPVIEDGFYYDFSYKRPFTPEDLAAIESEDGASSRRRTSRSRARVMPRDDAVAYFKSHRRALQGRDHRVDPVQRADLALHRRRVHRPVPRPARAVDRQAQGVQADEARRRLLARRLEERDAAADLRHRVGEEGRPRRLPASRIEEAEKRDHRKLGRAARPLPPAGRGAGHGVLAPEGLVDLAAGRAVHAPRLSRQRLPGSAHAADPRPLAVGEIGPLGRTTRTTCSRRSRRSATSRSSR